MYLCVHVYVYIYIYIYIYTYSMFYARCPTKYHMHTCGCEHMQTCIHVGHTTFETRSAHTCYIDV